MITCTHTIHCRLAAITLRPWAAVICVNTEMENVLSITRDLRSNSQTRQRWSNMNQVFCYCNTYFLTSNVFRRASCSVLFSCKMRKFVTRQPCWDHLRKYQAPPTSQSKLSHFTAWNRRCRSLGISQNTWITICWKVIMEFLHNDAKNILPTAGLKLIYSKMFKTKGAATDNGSKQTVAELIYHSSAAN